jgi:ubiquinol-cytochrome c reductase iron-sulfur subunit
MSGMHRRDLLTSSALALTGIGAMAALWPFLSALGPNAETMARQRIFNLAALNENGQAMLNLAGTPVLIFSRTPEELTRLEKTYAKPQTATSSNNPWHRSLRPDIMVCVARCTYDACIVVRNETRQGGRIHCPCCTSGFSLAGHRLSGPATRDLDVPGYRFISPGEIEFEAL